MACWHIRMAASGPWQAHLVDVIPVSKVAQVGARLHAAVVKVVTRSDHKLRRASSMHVNTEQRKLVQHAATAQHPKRCLFRLAA